MDGAHAVTFIKSQAGDVLLENFRVTTKSRIVRQAFKKHAYRSQRIGLFTHLVVKRTADSPSRDQPRCGNIIEVTEIQIGSMHQQGESLDAPC